MKRLTVVLLTLALAFVWSEASYAGVTWSELQSDLESLQLLSQACGEDKDPGACMMLALAVIAETNEQTGERCEVGVLTALEWVRAASFGRCNWPNFSTCYRNCGEVHSPPVCRNDAYKNCVEVCAVQNGCTRMPVCD